MSIETKTDSQVIRKMAEDIAFLRGRLDGDEGFIATTNNRMNNHAVRIRGLEIAVAGAIAVLAFIKFLLKG